MLIFRLQTTLLSAFYRLARLLEANSVVVSEAALGLLRRHGPAWSWPNHSSAHADPDLRRQRGRCLGSPSTPRLHALAGLPSTGLGSAAGAGRRMLLIALAQFFRDQLWRFARCALGAVQGLDQGLALGADAAEVHHYFRVRDADASELVGAAFVKGALAHQGQGLAAWRRFHLNGWYRNWFWQQRRLFTP